MKQLTNQFITHNSTGEKLPKPIPTGKHITEIKNKDGKIIRKRVQTFNAEPSMTDQSQEPDTNINNLMKGMTMRDYNNIVGSQNGFYADLSEIPKNLTSAMETVQKAQMAFDSLPSNVRERFGNSPESMMAFLSDKNNKEEAIKLGLIDAPPPPQEPIMVKVIPEPTTEKK